MWKIFYTSAVKEGESATVLHIMHLLTYNANKLIFALLL